MLSSVRWRRLGVRAAPMLRQPRAGLATISIRDDRVALWTQELERQQAAQATEQAQARGEPLELAVQYPGETPGSFAFSGVAGISTSIDVLKQMQQLGLPKFQALAAKIEGSGELLDLRTPLQRSGALRLLDFSSDEGKSVFWHSSAHVLGQALEGKFQDKIRLTDGPALSEGGFLSTRCSWRTDSRYLRRTLRSLRAISRRSSRLDSRLRAAGDARVCG
ncbi:hypothetical protein PF003_g32160 [Phytophthora fragariae]|nr:hypothetical protein PF003_g32160 [Phytophthora fragariae]